MLGILLKTRSGCTDLACFLENITSRACLLISGLNDIFHLCAHSDIFCRSLFNTSAEVLLLCTTENRKASSAKSFIVLCILEKGVNQEQTLVAHLLLQGTILKSDH